MCGIRKIRVVFLISILSKENDTGEATLYENSMESGEQLTLRKRISKEKALEVLKEQRELSLIDLCSCKVRYFLDGAALGTKSFFEEIFRENRSCFGFTRKEGARAVKGVKLESGIEPLCNMRDLRKSVFG